MLRPKWLLLPSCTLALLAFAQGIGQIDLASQAKVVFSGLTSSGQHLSGYLCATPPGATQGIVCSVIAADITGATWGTPAANGVYPITLPPGPPGPAGPAGAPGATGTAGPVGPPGTYVSKRNVWFISTSGATVNIITGACSGCSNTQLGGCLAFASNLTVDVLRNGLDQIPSSDGTRATGNFTVSTDGSTLTWFTSPNGAQVFPFAGDTITVKCLHQ